MMIIFGYTVYWYGLLYVVAFGIGYALLPRLARYRDIFLDSERWLEFLFWTVLAVLLGGRLGYVLLYAPGYFLLHPLEILLLSNGGMSSHGGFFAVGVAVWFLARRFKISLLDLLDVAVVPVALGLALGRLGNFINQELYVGNFALLAVAKDLLLALLGYLTLRRTSGYFAESGRVLGLFLVGYGILRFVTEYLRIQEWNYVWGLTYGQFLTIPLFLFGGYLLLRPRMPFLKV